MNGTPGRDRRSYPRPPRPTHKRRGRRFWSFRMIELAVFVGLIVLIGGYQLVTKGRLEVHPSAFRNCNAARAAGVTPIFRDHPRWGDHLDEDGDGRACEPLPAQG